MWILWDITGIGKENQRNCADSLFMMKRCDVISIFKRVNALVYKVWRSGSGGCLCFFKEELQK
jgi:hypothetical protein